MDEDSPVQNTRAAFVTKFFNQVEHYKRLVFRFWWIPVITFAIAVSVQWKLLKRDRVSFDSVGRMIVNIKIVLPDANVFSEDVNNFLGTQVELMKSDKIISRVNNHLRTNSPNLSPCPVDISVGLLAKSSIFNLRATGADGPYTQAYLEATMEEYINLKKDLFANASTATEATMEEKMKGLASELQKSKEELISFQATNNIILTHGEPENFAADFLTKLNNKLSEDRSELGRLKARTEIKGGLMESVDFSPLSTNLQPGVVAPTNTIVMTNHLPPNLGDAEVEYQDLDRKVRVMKLERAGYVERGRQSDLDKISAIDVDLKRWEETLSVMKEQSESKLDNQKRSLEAEIAELEKQVGEFEGKSLETSKSLTAFVALQDNQKRLQTRYDQMQANLQTLNVDRGIGQESVTILDAATPAVPVYPDRMKHMIMAGLTGIFLGIGIIVFRDRLDDRPRTFTELNQLFDMPVLGQIPMVKRKSRRIGAPILQLNDDRYPLIEAYRSFRSALLYKDVAEQRPKTIVITSANPGDGKSMISANFAITLAQAGARVLLIDADLRRGVLHKHFVVENSPGLADVLGGSCDWKKAVVQTSINNLSLIPRGVSPRHSDNLFANAGKFLEKVAGHYDYYLFDTAPVMVGDDVLSLAPHVDGLIMVVRSGFTSGRVAQAALDLLHLRQVKVIGLVFNAVHPRSSDFYHYRFKEYYSNHPAE